MELVSKSVCMRLMRSELRKIYVSNSAENLFNNMLAVLDHLTESNGSDVCHQ